jgi:rhodanese-related sulfurtransferase
MKTIAPQELDRLRQAGQALRVIDVRTPVEHSQVHIPGVELIPLDRLDPGKLRAAGCGEDTPLYLVCRTGGRATEAAKKLEQGGFSHCHVVEGGTLGWADSGLPVNRGSSKVIPLERQVRIVAGSLALTGVLLAHFVNPAFIWLSGFIGAGLIFAGITDWCGMGLLLARMPWNRA